jgi:putative endonuclease
MEFIVYILQSSVTHRYYCGQTDNITERLKRHNNGEVKSTKHSLPWKLIAQISLLSRSESMHLESVIKERGIQRWLNEHQQYLV